MKSFEYISTTEMVINDSGSLQQFYRLTNVLSKTRHVHFVTKQDDAYNVEWHFNYRGGQLTLQYNIYNGLSLLYNEKFAKTANELAAKLREIQ